MACFHPISGYRARSGRVVFSRKESLAGIKATIPCGQCIGCRLERSRQWAVRCVHEASMYADNCFITLTYNDVNLPIDGSLEKKDYQDFMKRLRRDVEPRKIRYYHCGEYGDRTRRPHYHAILFNIDFADKILFKQVNGQNLYTSKYLEEKWEKGFATVGDVTFESAAYVARYIMKKITGTRARDHYVNADPDTGEINWLEPEYTTMSRGGRGKGLGGIGASWFEKYESDVYPDDFISMRGKEFKPPKFYDSQYEITEPEKMEIIKDGRMARLAGHRKDLTPERLRDREVVKKAQLAMLKRNLGD